MGSERDQRARASVELFKNIGFQPECKGEPWNILSRGLMSSNIF